MKIYEKANDVHVRATVVYKKAADVYAYLNPEKTVKISASVLKDFFEKGVIVIDGVKEYAPVSFNLTTGVGTITYVETDGVTPTTAVLATLKSSEYVV